jgi:hypothetical protein
MWALPGEINEEAHERILFAMSTTPRFLMASLLYTFFSS